MGTIGGGSNMRPNPAEWAQYTNNSLDFRAICRSASTCSTQPTEDYWPHARSRFHLLAGRPCESVARAPADAESESHNPADLPPKCGSFPKMCAPDRGWRRGRESAHALVYYAAFTESP